MKLLANENFPLKSILYLKSKGFDIKSISDGRAILTFDRDYGELIFKQGYRPEKGVIYLRLDEYKAGEPGILVEDLINKKEFEFDNALTVLDKNGIRQRKY